MQPVKADKRLTIEKESGKGQEQSGEGQKKNRKARQDLEQTGCKIPLDLIIKFTSQGQQIIDSGYLQLGSFRQSASLPETMPDQEHLEMETSWYFTVWL